MSAADAPDRVDPDATESGPRSAADRIREAFQRTSGELPRLQIQVPGRRGIVVLACRPLTAREQARPVGTGLERAINLLLLACTEVLIRDPGDGTVYPASDLVEGVDQVAVDGHLADLLGLEGSTQAHILKALFMHQSGWIFGCSGRLLEWSNGGGAEELTPEQIDEALGEEGASTAA